MASRGYNVEVFGILGNLPESFCETHGRAIPWFPCSVVATASEHALNIFGNLFLYCLIPSGQFGNDSGSPDGEVEITQGKKKETIKNKLF